MKVYLFLLSNISRFDFLNHPVISVLYAKGTAFSFKQFFPLEPETALSYILTGCNPGKVGFLNINCGDLQSGQNMAEQTIFSFLRGRGFSVNYAVNNFPDNNTGFSFVHLTDYRLLDKVLDIVERKNTSVFIIAPVFEEYAEKAVNINTFLREKEIIETDSNGSIIWKNSLAYMKGYGQLWINLIGREPDGAVSPGTEYNDVRDALIKGITEKLIDKENGQPVIEHIYKKEEIFNGEHISKMSDLIVALRKGYGFSHTSNEIIFDESPVFRKKTKAYTAGSGILIGENIKENLNLKDIEIVNIAPTVLYYMRSEIPIWMEGKVEERFFSMDFILDTSLRYDNEKNISILSEEDEAIIKERLKGLGYL